MHNYIYEIFYKHLIRTIQILLNFCILFTFLTAYIWCWISRWNYKHFNSCTTNWSIFTSFKNCNCWIFAKYRRLAVKYTRMCSKYYYLWFIFWINLKYNMCILYFIHIQNKIFGKSFKHKAMSCIRIQGQYNMKKGICYVKAFKSSESHLYFFGYSFWMYFL